MAATEMPIEILVAQGATTGIQRSVHSPAPLERIHTTTRRARISRMFIGGAAMALMLAGTVASPAEARPTSNAVFSETQNCFLMDGDPYVYEWGDAVFVVCLWDDGSAQTEYLD